MSTDEQLKQYYIVETQSTHSIKYGISSSEPIDEKEIKNLIENVGLIELKQEWQGEKILAIRGPFNSEEFIVEHDKLFPHMLITGKSEKLMVNSVDELKSHHQGMMEDKDML